MKSFAKKNKEPIFVIKDWLFIYFYEKIISKTTFKNVKLNKMNIL